jgi:hypothetical protein
MNKREIKIGETFGQYTVLSEPFFDGKYRKVECQCSCGSIRVAHCSNITKLTQCVICRGKNQRKFNIGDELQSFTIIDYLKDGKIIVRCKCGKEYETYRYSIQNTKQCRDCYSQLIGDKHHSYKGYEFITGTYYSSIKLSAKSRNHKFLISIEYINQLLIDQDHKCNISNLPIILGNSKVKSTASLDRINSKLGYIEGNVQWVHTMIQRMKSDFDQSEFIKMCKKIAENN